MVYNFYNVIAFLLRFNMAGNFLTTLHVVQIGYSLVVVVSLHFELQ